jgi:glycine/D-amino acid oxidase-like deaminating enzyme
MASDRRSIAIIGGGIIGSTTAYYLTRHPKYDPSKHKITILEATGIASGASGKAGGLLALWAYPQALVPLSFRLHRELAEEHGGKDRWGYRGVGCGQIELQGRSIPAEKPVNAHPNGTGTGEPLSGVHTANQSSDANVSLEKRSSDSYAQLSKTGLPADLDWVDPSCVKDWDYMGDPSNTAQVHPYQFTTSMAKLAEEAGASIILGKVTRIEDEEAPTKTIHYTPTPTSSTSSASNSQTLTATDIILTAGPWTKTIWPSAPISNTRAHSVTIRPSRPTSAYCLFTSLSLPKNFRSGIKSRAQHVTPEIYARPNNELYACGEGDHLVPLPASTADVVVDDSRCQDIVDYCASFSDEMRDGEVLVRQACYLPLVSRGGGPLVGKTESKGVWIAAGHTCWGICNGPATGKLMSEMIFDGKAVSSNVASLDPRRVMR